MRAAGGAVGGTPAGALGQRAGAAPLIFQSELFNSEPRPLRVLINVRGAAGPWLLGNEVVV